jgi:SAM-dependent methyltransferase
VQREVGPAVSTLSRVAPLLVSIGFIGAGAALVYGRRCRRSLASHRAAGAADDAPVGSGSLYELASRLLLRPMFRRVVSEIATVAPDGASVLEIGCGPGHLAALLARTPGLRVTGIDLDPGMVARADAHANREVGADRHRPRFLVADVAALPFPDASFDLVVSTFSMHHWADPTVGLAEIRRVLRPGGRALIWDPVSRIAHLHDQPSGSVRGASRPLDRWPFEHVRITPWPWPWRIRWIERIECS